MSQPLREWKSSYYDKDARKWISGRLELYPAFVLFSPTKGDPRRRLHFNEVVNIRKETTNLFYSALTVETHRNDEKHWFSSFPNRDSTHAFLHHFWKNAGLLGTLQQPVTSPSVRDSELLRLVDDAQRTLTGAAVELHAQGQQIKQSVQRMNALHNDLGISTSLLKDMGSWLDTWNASKDLVQYAKRRKGSHTSPAVDIKYPILYAIDSRVHWPGSLTFSETKMCVEDERGRQVFQAATGSRLELIGQSPYQLTIAQESLTVQIISAVAVAIVEDVGSRFKAMIRYEMPRSTTLPPSDDLTGWLDEESVTKEMEPGLGKEDEAELIAVSRGLENMKLLAMNLKEETEEQIAQISELDDSVQKGHEHIKHATKRTRDLAM